MTLPAAGRVTDVNLSCYQNPDYTIFYNKLWRHESCHARPTFRKFEERLDRSS